MNNENIREYHCVDPIGPGVTVRAPEKCCLFCKHCDDIWWDYTNGPYMLSCEIFYVPKDCGGKGVPSEVGGTEGKCKFFEEQYE